MRPGKKRREAEARTTQRGPKNRPAAQGGRKP